MPKVRPASTQDLEFKVFPWQTKKKNKNASLWANSISELCKVSDVTKVSKQVSPFQHCTPLFSIAKKYRANYLKLVDSQRRNSTRPDFSPMSRIKHEACPDHREAPKQMLNLEK